MPWFKQILVVSMCYGMIHEPTSGNYPPGNYHIPPMEEENHLSSYLSRGYVGLSPLPVTVTTRIITFLVGDPYKPSFVTVTGRGDNPKDMLVAWMVCVGTPTSWMTPIIFRHRRSCNGCSLRLRPCVVRGKRSQCVCVCVCVSPHPKNLTSKFWTKIGLFHAKLSSKDEMGFQLTPVNVGLFQFRVGVRQHKIQP